MCAGREAGIAQASGRPATEGACEGAARLRSTPESEDFLQAEHLPAQSGREEGARDPVVTRGYRSCPTRNSDRKAGMHHLERRPGRLGLGTVPPVQGTAAEAWHSWHARLVADLSLHCWRPGGRSPTAHQN